MAINNIGNFVVSNNIVGRNFHRSTISHLTIQNQINDWVYIKSNNCGLLCSIMEQYMTFLSPKRLSIEKWGGKGVEDDKEREEDTTECDR